MATSREISGLLSCPCQSSTKRSSNVNPNVHKLPLVQKTQCTKEVAVGREEEDLGGRQLQATSPTVEKFPQCKGYLQLGATDAPESWCTQKISALFIFMVGTTRRMNIFPLGVGWKAREERSFLFILYLLVLLCIVWLWTIFEVGWGRG